MNGITVQNLPSTRSVFDLAWPLTIKALMLHGIVVIDAYLVSSLGERAVAVLGLSGSIAGVLLGVIAAFSNATQIRIAQAFGSEDRTFLKSALVAGLVTNVAVVLLGLVILSLAAGPVIDSLAHDSWIAAQAKAYLTVFAIVIVAESVGHCLTSYFNGCGETRLPALSYCVAVPVNIVVSLILIHGHFGAPELGVVGAAWGSVFATVLQVGFLVCVLMARHRHVFRADGWRNGTFAATVLRHIWFSLPIAATFASAVISASACGLMYAMLPVNAFAALTLIGPWVQVAGTLGICWAQASGIIVAQLLGRKTPAEALDRFLSGAWRLALMLAGVVALFYAGICLASPWIYSDLDHETQAMLMMFLPILLMLPFPKGSNAMCGHTLRAGGETVYVMHIFLWSAWLVKVPLTALMIIVLDLSVFWVFSLLLFEELVKFFPFHLRHRKGLWKQGLADD